MRSLFVRYSFVLPPGFSIVRSTLSDMAIKVVLLNVFTMIL